MTLTFTEEQVAMIRRAMCNESIKHLAKAFETAEELKALGRDDKYLVDMEMEQRDVCQKIIEMIDSAN